MIERLLAEAIARKHEALQACVPQRHGEHAVERIDEVRPALLVEVGDDLGVRARPEAMAAACQVAAQAGVVVDLAVAHDVHVARLVRERLGTAPHVDDREAAAAEAGAAGDDPSVAVGAAMQEATRHALEHLRGRRRHRAHHAVDAAHGC